MTVNGTDFRINEPWPYKKGHYKKIFHTNFHVLAFVWYKVAAGMSGPVLSGYFGSDASLNDYHCIGDKRGVLKTVDHKLTLLKLNL
jgi:hypothetical protein